MRRLLIILALVTAIVYVQAGVLVPFQLKVYDANVLIANGDLQVTIFDQSTGGNQVYDSVSDFNDSIINGYVNITLGSGQTLDLNYGQVYYMDLAVNGSDIDFGGSERQSFESNFGTIYPSRIANGAISNTQVNGSAAIDWTKISKTGSSLADFTTRNASLLNFDADFNSMFVRWPDANSLFINKTDGNNWYGRKTFDENITGNWTFSNATYFGGGFSNGGITIQNGTLYTQNIVIANDFNSATVTAIDVNGNYQPFIDNAFNLGGSSNRWQNIYGVAGTFTNLFATNLSGTSLSAPTITGPVSFTGSTTFGTPLSDGNLATITTSGKIGYTALPQADLNAYYTRLNASNTGDVNISGLIKTGTGFICDATKCYSLADLNNNTATSLVNYYTKTQVDANFLNHYTKAQIDANFTNFYTKAQIDSNFLNFYTRSQVDNNFTNFTKTTDLNAAIGSNNIIRYGNNISLLTNDAGFITSATDTNWQTSWITFDANNKTYYYTRQQVDANFLKYYTKGEVDTNFGNYTKTADLNTSIGSSGIVRVGANVSVLTNDAGYITSFSDTNWQTGWVLFDTNNRFYYYTKTQVDNNFANYYTKSQADANWGNYVKTTDLNTAIGSVGIVRAGDNVSRLVNDAGYLTSITTANLPLTDLNAWFVRLNTVSVGDLNLTGFLKTDRNYLCNATTCYLISDLNRINPTVTDTNWQTSFGTLDANLRVTFYTRSQTDANFGNYTKTSDLNTAIGSEGIVRAGDNVSRLTNDAGFITSFSDTNWQTSWIVFDTNNRFYYYTKSQVDTNFLNYYTRAQVDNNFTNFTKTTDLNAAIGSNNIIRYGANISLLTNDSGYLTAVTAFGGQGNVQYNDGNVLNGVNDFNWNNSSKLLWIGGDLNVARDVNVGRDVNAGGSLFALGGLKVNLDVNATNVFGNADWNQLRNYPASCSAGQAITQIGDSITCTAFIQLNSSNSGDLNVTGLIRSDQNKLCDATSCYTVLDLNKVFDQNWIYVTKNWFPISDTNLNTITTAGKITTTALPRTDLNAWYAKLNAANDGDLNVSGFLKTDGNYLCNATTCYLISDLNNLGTGTTDTNWQTNYGLIDTNLKAIYVPKSWLPLSDTNLGTITTSGKIGYTALPQADLNAYYTRLNQPNTGDVNISGLIKSDQNTLCDATKCYTITDLNKVFDQNWIYVTRNWFPINDGNLSTITTAGKVATSALPLSDLNAWYARLNASNTGDLNVSRILRADGNYLCNAITCYLISDLNNVGSGAADTNWQTNYGLLDANLKALYVPQAWLPLDDANLNTLSWTKLQNYPTGCLGHQAVQAIGDTLTCVDVNTLYNDKNQAAGVNGNLQFNNLGVLGGGNDLNWFPGVFLWVSGDVNVGRDLNVGLDLNVTRDAKIGGNLRALLDVNAANFFGNLDWNNLRNYPGACAAGQAITQIGDSVTCTAFLTSVTSSGKRGNIQYNSDGNVLNGMDDFNFNSATKLLWVGGDVNVAKDLNVGLDINAGGSIFSLGNIRANLDVNATNLFGNVDWNQLRNYPSACQAGQAITAIGDSITCTAFGGGSTAAGGNQGNIQYNDGNVFNGVSDFNWDNSAKILWINGDLNVARDLNIGFDLNVGRDLNVVQNLTVNGFSRFSDLNATRNLQVNLDLNVDKNLSVMGQVGINNPSPKLSLDVNGALALETLRMDFNSDVNITGDNQAVTVNNRSFIRLGSNSTTSTQRTFTLSKGLQFGQVLVLMVAPDNGSNEVELADAGITNLSATWPATTNQVADTLTLIWTGYMWVELARTAN